MTRDELEKLVVNPHYKMSSAQIAELAAYRQADGKPSQTVPKHNPTFVKHDPGLKAQDDEAR